MPIGDIHSDSLPQIEKAPALPFGKRCLARVVALVVRVWYATLRVRTSARLQPLFSDITRPNIFLLWHNRITMGPLLYFASKRTRKVYTLISASKDGTFAAAVLKNMGMNVIRGSSSRRSLQALREMMRALNADTDIVITPDGPRGPLYSMSASAALLLRHSNARIVLLMPTPHWARRAKSWDGCYIPLPFSRVDIDAEVIEDASRLVGDSDYDFRDTLKRRYDAITRESLPHPCPEADHKESAHPHR